MRNWMAEKPCLGGIERKVPGNEYLITLLRKAGFACHPSWAVSILRMDPQRSLPLEEKQAFQRCLLPPPECICLFFCLNKSKS